MDYKLGPNDTLVHYEELGGLDLKVTITEHMVATFLQKYERLTKKQARNRAKSIPHADGWREAMDEDERFYKFVKSMFAKEAVGKISSPSTYMVCWLENGDYFEQVITNKDKAYKLYRLKKTDGRVVLVMQRKKGGWYSSPLWKSLFYEDVLLEFQKKWIGPTGPESVCKKKRQVMSCEQCRRHLIYGPDGCPLYTAKVNEELERRNNGEEEAGA